MNEGKIVKPYGEWFQFSEYLHAIFLPILTKAYDIDTRKKATWFFLKYTRKPTPCLKSYQNLHLYFLALGKIF